MGAPKPIKAIAIVELKRQAEIDAVVIEFGGDTDSRDSVDRQWFVGHLGSSPNAGSALLRLKRHGWSRQAVGDFGCCIAPTKGLALREL
jgi:hypothetical protein